MTIRWRWVFAAVITFIIFIIVHMPAAQVINRISLPKTIGLHEVSGTIWNGQLKVLTIKSLPIKNVSWELHPLSLLAGKASISLKAGNVRNADEISFFGPLQISLTNYQHISAQQFSLYLPVDRVLSVVNLPIPIEANGRISAKISELELNNKCVSLDATGDWLRANVKSGKHSADLGEFSGVFSCSNDLINLQVEEPNKLGLNLNAKASIDMSKIEVGGKIKPSDDLPSEIHKGASFFGRPDKQGYINFKL